MNVGKNIFGNTRFAFPKSPNPDPKMPYRIANATPQRPSGLAAQTANLFEGGEISNEMTNEIPRKAVPEIQTI